MISFDAIYADVKAAMATLARIEKLLVEIHSTQLKIENILDTRLPADFGQGE